MSELPIPFIERDAYRARLFKYSKKAWDMLSPPLEPSILDIGCGSGVLTIQLAHWSQGKVIGMDIDQGALDLLKRRVEKEGLEARVGVLLGSLLGIKFPDASFDIVWAEGVLSFIGFDRALREWRRLLRPGGFMVVHDAANHFDRSIMAVEDLGYELIGHFLLPDDAWWVDYYLPLQEEVREKRDSQTMGPGSQAELEAAQAEIEWYKANPEEARSWFIVLKRA